MNLNDLGERQSKIILERIHQTEKNASHLIEALNNFARKESKVRDKTDELAKVVKDISEGEHFNHTTEKALENLGNGLTFLADHQSLEIQRVEEKVLPNLTQYQIICQNAKEEVKNQIALRDREISKRKQLDITKRMKNENEVILSNMQISKILKEISTISEQFEAQKISDVKECLENFILIQLKYHASCIEVLSMRCYQDVTSIDEKKDVEQFKKHFQQSEKPNSGFFLSRIKSQSLGALSSMLDKKPMREKSASKRLKNINQSSLSLNSLESNDAEMEIRKESHAIELSADSIETKTSESEEDSDDSETEVDEKEPVNSKVHQVKRFQ